MTQNGTDCECINPTVAFKDRCLTPDACEAGSGTVDSGTCKCNGFYAPSAVSDKVCECDAKQHLEDDGKGSCRCQDGYYRYLGSCVD